MRIRQKTKSEVVVPDTLTIHRDQWLQGSRDAHSVMLDDADNMCCLGFVAHAAGVGSEDMCRINTPRGVVVQSVGGKEFPFHNIPVLTTLKGPNSVFTTKAMLINDESEITLAEREKKLTNHFAKAGIALKFRGKYGQDSIGHDAALIRERAQNDKEEDGAASSSE